MSVTYKDRLGGLSLDFLSKIAYNLIWNILLLSTVNRASVINTDNKMTTEVWRVHILWIFQITRAKSPIQNCLGNDFQELVRIVQPLKKKRIVMM